MEHKDYLFFIIPGTLFLMPLMKQSLLPIKAGNLEFIPFLISAFVIGYIIHSVYRVLYRYIFFAHRPLIKYLINKLKEMDVTVTAAQADNLYVYYIYTNPEFSSFFSLIRYRSQACSSIFSCFLGAFSGLLLNVFYVGGNIFYWIYGFILLVLAINYYITFWKWLNDDEIFLLEANFNKKFKNNKEEIERILKDVT